MKLHSKLIKKDMQIRMELGNSPVYYWASLASSVDSDRKDEECGSPRIRFSEKGRSWQAEVLWKSSVWQSKKHYYKYENNCLTHRVEVRGRGRISRLTYFSGTVEGEELASVPGFGSVYVPCPNFLDKPWSHPSEYTGISAGNITRLWGSALNSGPLMLAFGERDREGWIAAGLLAKPGEYNFHTMSFNLMREHAAGTPDNIIGTQAVTLDYPGYEKVDGSWASPEIILFRGKNPSDCLDSYCKKVFRERCAARITGGGRPGWWTEPIFCTWHEQVALGRKEKRAASGKEGFESGSNYFDKINEKNVRRWLDIFERKGIRFGTIIFDARWQKDNGENEPDPSKFPDLRAFIEELHARDYRVLLWMNAWETAGIPKSWCVKRAGVPVMADPGHPKYREYVREMVARLLGNGPDCYNADGLKIDGTNVLPGGEGLRSFKDMYGFELLRCYLKLVYDAAKEADPESLISIYGANPYLSDCCDMVRLGDLYTTRGDPLHTMRWRSSVIRAGIPHAILDTDGTWRFSLRENGKALLKEQVKLGIPCIYQAEHLIKNRTFAKEKIRKLIDDDYITIKQSFDYYRKKRSSGIK